MKKQIKIKEETGITLKDSGLRNREIVGKGIRINEGEFLIADVGWNWNGLTTTEGFYDALVVWESGHTHCACLVILNPDTMIYDLETIPDSFDDIFIKVFNFN